VKPADFNDWTGYPELCLFAGNEREYRRARKMMLERFGSRKEPTIAQQLARACLLLPAAQGDEDELVLATALADRSLTAAKPTVAEWQYAYYAFVKGLAEYRLGHLDAAIRLMDGEASKAMGPCPKLIEAMALKDKGNDADAVRALADAVVKFDWRPVKAASRDLWIYHILRREAERKVLPNLAALLDGSRQPQGNNERLAILAPCQFQGLHGRCANVFIDALAAEPDLIENRSLNAGFTAACAGSALALYDAGEKDLDIADSDRGPLREHALQWLREQLAVELRHYETKDPRARAWLERELIALKADPGLAGLRDSAALQLLVPEKRDRYIGFWKAIDDAISRIEDANPLASTIPSAQRN
jgi:serine/threonine-protein kinase